MERAGTMYRRADSEHSILADCKDKDGVLSSQMAYFAGSPGSTPQDVAVVATSSGQTRLWSSATTSALFTDSGVTFTAQIGPLGANDTYAGTGYNGYVNFTCWQRYVQDLYTYGNNTCSMVYDCDHEAAPATTSSSASTTASSTASATSTAASKSADTGLSTGAIIGISVGIGLGALIAIIGAFLVWRAIRTNKKRNQANDAIANLSHSGSPTSPGSGGAMPGMGPMGSMGYMGPMSAGTGAPPQGWYGGSPGSATVPPGSAMTGKSDYEGWLPIQHHSVRKSQVPELDGRSITEIMGTPRSELHTQSSRPEMTLTDESKTIMEDDESWHIPR